MHYEQGDLILTKILNEDNVPKRNTMLKRVLETIHDWDVEKRDEWMSQLFHQRQLVRVSEDKVHKNLHASFNFLMENGFMKHLLEMIAKCYSGYMDADSEKVSLLESLPPCESQAGMSASMLLADYTHPQRRTPLYIKTAKDMVEHNGVLMMCNGMLYGCSTIKYTCAGILKWCVIEKIIRDQLILDDNKVLCKIMDCIVYALQLPDDFMVKEFKTVRGTFQRNAFSADLLLKHCEDDYCRHRWQVLYENTSSLLTKVLKYLPTCQIAIASTPKLFDTILQQFRKLPSPYLIVSGLYTANARSLALLTRAPLQLEDASNDYEQMYVDFVNNTEGGVASIVKTYLWMLKKVNSVQYANDLVKQFVDIHKFLEKPDGKWKAMDLLCENPHDRIIGNINSAEELLLYSISDMSFSNFVAQDLAVNHAWLVDLMERFLNLNGKNTNTWVVAIRNQCLSGMINPYIEKDKTYGQHPTDVYASKDFIGACVVLLRNVMKYNKNVEQNKRILIDQKYFLCMLHSSSCLKAKGVEVLKQQAVNSTSSALIYFSNALHVLPKPGDVDYFFIESNKQLCDLKVVLHSNRAEMYLQLGDQRAAKIDLETALKLDPQHEKSKKRMERITIC
ncbi:Ttc12 [Acrasis kona]|uniref:Ttc12 n=1 Tax=Acrasis kona TaxID=1008807 RepID=A0AAW2YKF0_9EUKA